MCYARTFFNSKHNKELSPTIFHKRGFRFYFYSREEPRMHVHVGSANGDAKFWLEPIVELAENYGLRSGEISRARELIDKHHDEIEERWKNTSDAEVTQIGTQGIWMSIGGKEFFLTFKDFPWFRSATVAAIHNVKLLNSRHLFWADLDVDLDIESIEHPGRFPLIAK
ncbi:MAG TPA: DUF4160 domain-containing protein [Pyrinomonadaceae bacterium]|nr:DUF4160 domain-containing protein [Pyrinomonadaceae bacterium]